MLDNQRLQTTIRICIIIAFHGKNVYANATHYYVYSTLPVLFRATVDRIAQCLGNITTAITAP